MKYAKIMMLVLVAMAIFGKAFSMLPPETFKDPIFASQGDSGDDDGGESTDFA